MKIMSTRILCQQGSSQSVVSSLGSALFRTVATVLIGSLICSQAAALRTQGEPQAPYVFDLDQPAQPDLAELLQEAGVLVEADLSWKMPKTFDLSYVSVEEMQEALAKETLQKHLASKLGLAAEVSADEDLPASVTEPLANWVLAKYFPAEGKLLFVFENFHRSLLAVGLQPIDSKRLIRAVMVHELVHVADETKHQWSKRMLACDTSDTVAAMNSVIEGHAQVVARRICKAAGWAQDFDDYTSMIGFTASMGEGAAAELLARAISVNISFSYHSGEAFWKHVLSEGGVGIEARVFATPPDSVALISHPNWYLNPDLRPSLVYDLKRGLDKIRTFESTGPGGNWTATEIEITTAQLAVSLAILGEEERDRALESVIHSNAMVLQPTAAPQSSLFQAVLYETGDSVQGARWLAMQEAVMRMRDETMKEGIIKIVSSTYEELVVGGASGLYVHKTVEYQGALIDVKSVVMALGPLNVEMTASAYEIDRETIIERATLVLAAVSESDESASDEASEAKQNQQDD